MGSIKDKCSEIFYTMAKDWKADKKLFAADLATIGYEIGEKMNRSEENVNMIFDRIIFPLCFKYELKSPYRAEEFTEFIRAGMNGECRTGYKMMECEMIWH